MKWKFLSLSIKIIIILHYLQYIYFGGIIISTFCLSTKIINCSLDFLALDLAFATSYSYRYLLVCEFFVFTPLYWGRIYIRFKLPIWSLIDFSSCIWSSDHHQNQFLCAPVPSIGSHWSIFCLYSFASFVISYKLNHPVCIILCLLILLNIIFLCRYFVCFYC